MEKFPDLGPASQAREAFRDEALASWAAYRQTGRHLAADEVMAWLGRWGGDVESEPPACHD